MLKTHAIDSKEIAVIASNGKQVAYTTCGCREVLYVLDFESGQKLWTLKIAFPFGVCYAPGSNCLLVAGFPFSHLSFSIKQYCSITGCSISRLTSGLFKPSVMTARDKKLVVADGQALKVYQME